ncbi:MAG TPA: cupin domain-containing protein [Anaerolineales bacterium]|nr:cupin domain-containing protein [Anaerolineales bacterium]
MKMIEIDSLRPSGGEVAVFNGFEQEASVSFFIVHIAPGKGPKKHRHPYEEIFILLDGEIEAVVEDQLQTIGKDRIVIIPAGTWHEFRVCSDSPVSMINLHPVPKMITEWASA